MPRLPDKATAEEARKHAGITDDVAWRRFLEITKGIARNLLKEDVDLRWKNVRFSEKCKVMEDTNAQLSQDGISEVEIDLIGWRYSRVFASIKHAEARSSKAADDSTIAGSSTGALRPYDPVRDV